MDIQILMDKITEKLNRIRDLVGRITSKINGLLSHVPKALHWVVSKVENLWEKFCTKMNQFWNWFAGKLASVGDPFQLGNTGQRWNDELGAPVHRRANKVDKDDLLVDDNWKGEGATSYKSKIDGQKEALNAVGQTYASAVSSALNGMKAAIWVFWGAVVIALVTLVVGFVTGLAAEGTIVGIPAGIFAQISAVVTFLLAAGAGVLNLKVAAGNCASSLRNLTMYSDKWPSFALGG